MPFINVCADDIFIFSFEEFLAELFTDFVRCLKIRFARCKRLYQMISKNAVLFASYLLRETKLRISEFRRTAERRNRQPVKRFLGIDDIVESFFQRRFDRMDFCNSHISSCFFLISETSSA